MLISTCSPQSRSSAKGEGMLYGGCCSTGSTPTAAQPWGAAQVSSLGVIVEDNSSTGWGCAVAVAWGSGWVLPPLRGCVPQVTDAPRDAGGGRAGQ